MWLYPSNSKILLSEELKRESVVKEKETTEFLDFRALQTNQPSISVKKVLPVGSSEPQQSDSPLTVWGFSITIILAWFVFEEI